jgi:predicted DNA-binding transcriptional regulator AlpA
MTSRREPRLADAAEIAAEQGLTSARISQFYTERTENAAGKAFPGPVDKRGRARLWDHAEVTEWFSHRSSARLTEHRPPSIDPETLLNAAEASRYLGYKNSNQVTTFVRDHPGYFPEPDVVEDKGTAENPYRRQLWKVETLQEWMASRPGRGRRAGAKQAPPLPEVSADGDPDELLGASQAAALLGYKSVGSFSSSLSQGNLPLMKTTDGVAENAGRQNGRRRWTRRRILEQAAQRSKK